MKFRRCLELHLNHLYFANGKGNSFRFVATDDCERYLRRNAFFLRNVDNGFVLIKDMDTLKNSVNAAQDANPAGGHFFDVAVYSSNPLLSVYSNLEIDFRAGKVYYIGNTIDGESKNQKEKNKRMTLSQPGTKKETEAVQVVLKTKKFMFPVDASAGDTFILKDKQNNIVGQWQIQGQNIPGQLYADVSRKPAGIYTVEKNGRIIDYYYADNHLFKEKPAFIIGIGPVNFKTRADGDFDKLHFKVTITSRSVFWNYYVYAPANGKRLDKLRIDNNNNKLLKGVKFSNKGVDEQRKRAFFVSGSPIPLIENAYKSIELIEKGKSGTPLIPHMPNADISSLHVKEGRWFSEIFVYI